MNHVYTGLSLGMGSLLTAGLLWSQPLQAETGNSLEVAFSGLKNSQGQMCVNLFAGPKGFPEGGSDSDLKLQRCVAIAAGAASITLTDLEPGTYAITAHHDLDNDGKMKQGAFGIPEEGFGFSNNPPLGFSSPSFQETQFQVSGGKTTLEIRMNYLG